MFTDMRNSFHCLFKAPFFVFCVFVDQSLVSNLGFPPQSFFYRVDQFQWVYIVLVIHSSVILFNMSKQPHKVYHYYPPPYFFLIQFLHLLYTNVQRCLIFFHHCYVLHSFVQNFIFFLFFFLICLQMLLSYFSCNSVNLIFPKICINSNLGTMYVSFKIMRKRFN